MSSKFGEFDLKLPRELEHLPSFSFTADRPVGRDQTIRSADDVAYGITTLGQLREEAKRRFGADRQRPRPALRKE